MNFTIFKKSESDKKWWQYRSIQKKEYGYFAILSLLAGLVVGGIVGGILFYAGLGFGIIRIFEKSKE